MNIIANVARDERVGTIDRQWTQIGGWAGILFVVTVVAGGFVEGTTPNLDGSATKLTGYVLAHRHGIIASGICGAVAMAFVLVFIATIVQLTSQPGGGNDPLPRIVGYSGTATALCFALVPAPATAVAILAAQPGGLEDVALIRVLFDLSSVMEGVFHLMAVFLLIALGWVAVRRRLVGPWLGWLASFFALVTALGGGVAMAVASGGALAVTTPISGSGLALVVLIISITLLRARTSGAPIPATFSNPAPAGSL